jgi:CheY-like chemotaxis protein
VKSDAERCLNAGMDGYLSEPILPQALDAILEGYVTRRREFVGTHGTPVST